MHTNKNYFWTYLHNPDFYICGNLLMYKKKATEKTRSSKTKCYPLNIVMFYSEFYRENFGLYAFILKDLSRHFI